MPGSEELHKRRCHVEAEICCGKEKGKYGTGSLRFRLQGGEVPHRDLTCSGRKQHSAVTTGFKTVPFYHAPEAQAL